jgi:ribosomal protein L12E/L44/L45/RPP1/RPP2
LPRPSADRDTLVVKISPDLARQFRIVAAVRDINLNTALTHAVVAYVAATTAAEKAASRLGAPAISA